MNTYKYNYGGMSGVVSARTRTDAIRIVRDFHGHGLGNVELS